MKEDRLSFREVATIFTWRNRFEHLVSQASRFVTGIHMAIREGIVIQDLPLNFWPGRLSRDQYTCGIDDPGHIRQLRLAIKCTQYPLQGLNANMEDSMTSSTDRFQIVE